MRDAVKKGMALGFGLAAASREQAEKVIDELVKRGELSQQESREFVNDLMKKGEESQQDMDERIHTRLKEVLDELNLATKEDIRALEDRVYKLENKLNNPEE